MIKYMRKRNFKLEFMVIFIYKFKNKIFNIKYTHILKLK